MVFIFHAVSFPCVFLVFFFFFLQHRSMCARQSRHEGVCGDVVRARGTWVFVFLAVRFLSCSSWFVCACFFLAISKRVRQADIRDFLSLRNEGGGQKYTVARLFAVRFL